MSVSVIIPCLNEEASISSCVQKAQLAFAGKDLREIIVVDNGSVDQSRSLAEKAGAHVIVEESRGYGAAILRGLREASGDFLVIADADNTYDFGDGELLVAALAKEGSDFAIGSRLSPQMEAGAMPWLHRHIGTPLLTLALNAIYGTKLSDINCGLRAIRRTCLPRLRLRSPGMEFASEMVIHAQKAGLKMTERPIRYYRRRGGEAKLRTFRDGWRHLRFILLCAPFLFYCIPSTLTATAGLWLLTQNRLGFQVMGGGFLLFSLQFLLFGGLSKAVLWTADSFLVDRRVGQILEKFRLEVGLMMALLLFCLGSWQLSEVQIQGLIRGGWLMALSIQIFFASILLSLILHKKHPTGQSPD